MAGWESRARAMTFAKMAGVRLAVDVQHAYRPHQPTDRGTVFTLGRGLHVTEVALATGYAAAMVQRLRRYGAEVLTNDPLRGKLVGYYSERQREAEAFGAIAYLACHVNASAGRYTLTEYPAGGGGSELAASINREVVAAFPDVFSASRAMPITGAAGKEGKGRGWVCVGYFPAARASVLLEPFFGDTIAHQEAFASPTGLQRLGEVLADGVADWFSRL